MDAGGMQAFFPYSETTDGVTVRVSVSFLADQSDSERGRWFWAYHIRIENGRADPVQLLTRHWRITDARGNENRVDGDGVIGEQPVIQPGGAHDYVSGCPLPTPSGHMEGSYRMAHGQTGILTVEIPRFDLIAPATAR